MNMFNPYEIGFDLALHTVIGDTTVPGNVPPPSNLNLSTDAPPGTPNDLSSIEDTFFQQLMIGALIPNLHYLQFGRKLTIPQGKGKTTTTRKVDRLPVLDTPLTEGRPPDGQKLNFSEMEISLKQFGGYVGFSDILDLTALVDFASTALGVLGTQGAETIDVDIRNSITNGTNVLYAASLDLATGAETEVTARADLTATSFITRRVLVRAVNIMRKNNVPAFPDGYYVLICHPSVVSQMMLGAYSSGIFTGEVGRLAGVRFVTTTHAPILTGTAGSVYQSILLGGDATTPTGITTPYAVVDVAGSGNVQTIIKPIGSAGTSDPLDQMGTVGWKAYGGAAIVNEESLLRIESTAAIDLNAATNVPVPIVP